MAEAVVSYVLGKISEAAYQKALMLYGLGGKIEWAKRQLIWVSAFLKDAEAKQNKDERVKLWVKEVREVTYMIEDALDKFFVEVGGVSKKATILETVRKLPRELYARHKVVTEIDNIKKRFVEIKENCQEFGILSIESKSTGSTRQPAKSVIIPEIDQTDVVGFKDDVKNICDLLLDKSDLRRSVVSIVGAGGRGKTTVATQVYKSVEVERNFQIRIWLVISKEYQLLDVLKKMLKKLGRKDEDMLQMNQEDLITEIYMSMKDKRYLVMLDDVWSTDLWTELEGALRNDNNGSRVLITTRNSKVASKADLARNTYQLRILNEEESTNLLLKKAFPHQRTNEYPDDLHEQANLLAKKCGGWPLALVVLGGILSTYPDYSTWDETVKKFNWNTDGSDCMDIISTSYDELPMHLKPCFMYFASFPEDYEIEVSRLIRMWIAEGFIQQEAKKTMEDTAKNYLEELVQRCMVQVSRLSRLGKMSRCRVHDILHDLAIDKAKENDFLTVYSKSINADSESATHTTIMFSRRAAYHEFDNTRPLEAIGPNLRSLIYFGKGFPDCNKLMMTRVVDLEDPTLSRLFNFMLSGLFDDVPMVDLKWLQHVSTTLRYLRIDSSNLNKTNFSCLAYLKHLQTLETRRLNPKDEEQNKNYNTFWNKHCSCLPCHKNITSETTFWNEDEDEDEDEDIIELPSSFWINNKMLRSFISVEGYIYGPPSSANMKNLQRLDWVLAKEEWAVKLPHFPHIRKLKLNLRRVQHCWIAISSLMSKLENLASLTLFLFYEHQMTFITPAFREYRKVRSLNIIGEWPKNAVIDGSLLPPNLVKLQLKVSNLEEDPMPELGKLLHLRLLVLKYNSYMGEKLSCSRGGFRCLQRLQLHGLHNLKELKIEEGAMPMLNVLEIGNCEKMGRVPDLQYLTNLRQLTLDNMPRIFISKLNGEDQHKVKHIPSIIIEE